MNESSPTPSSRPIPVLVIGVGNLLMGDDGLGVHAVHRMMTRPAPRGVVMMDAGTSMLAIQPDVMQADRLLVLDAVRIGSPPGALHRLDGNAVGPPRCPRSLHEYGVGHLLDGIPASQRPGTVAVLGLEPGRLTFSMTLSPEVACRLDGLVDAAWRTVYDWLPETRATSPRLRTALEKSA